VAVGEEERIEIAKRRIVSNLRTYTVANLRTLEQKIADAGPPGQRIDPHLRLSKRTLEENSLHKMVFMGRPGWIPSALGCHCQAVVRLARHRWPHTHYARFQIKYHPNGRLTSYHRDPHARREHHEESDTNASLPLTPVVLAYPFALMIKA